MTFHPKTSGAAVGAALGTVIVAVLSSFHSVHLTAEAYSAIPAFLSVLGAWIVPSPASAQAPNPPQGPVQ